MDYTQPHFWIALGVGGTLVAALSLGQQLMSKQADDPYSEGIRIRPVLRDFCLGAFLTAMIYMFVPESISSWIEAGQATISNTIQSVKSQSGGGAAAPIQQDFDLQIGPARF